MDFEYGKFTTNDGAVLNFAHRDQQKKCKKDLILLPGWSQSIEEYTVIWQNHKLNKNYNVYAIDTRGQGQSSKVTYGYQINRLAQDLREFILFYKLQEVTMITHSMGCCVVWNYIQNYGEKSFDRYVFIDQSIDLLPMDLPIPADTTPQNNATNMKELGAVFTWSDPDGPNVLRSICNALKGPDGATVKTAFMSNFFTAAWIAANPEQFNYFVRQSLLMPLEQSSDLLLNHSMSDWRQVIPQIEKDTLLFGGKVSLIPYQTIEKQGQLIANSEVHIFNETVGSHFMFVEAPEEFMAIVNKWLPRARKCSCSRK